MRRLKPALLFIWHYHRYWPANRKTINQCRYRPVSCISYEYGALANMFQPKSERSHSSLLIHAYQAFRTPDWQHFYCHRSGFVLLPARMVILGGVFYHPELIVPLARLMLILPLLLCLILFATGVPHMAGWMADSGTLLVVVLGAGGALLLVLAQVFNQGRIGHMALLVLASFALQHYGLPAPGVAYSGSAYWLLFWLALLLPLNIVLIRWLPEYRPWSVGALSWPVLLLVQLVLVWAVPR